MRLVNNTALSPRFAFSVVHVQMRTVAQAMEQNLHYMIYPDGAQGQSRALIPRKAVVFDPRVKGAPWTYTETADLYVILTTHARQL